MQGWEFLIWDHLYLSPAKGEKLEQFSELSPPPLKLKAFSLKTWPLNDKAVRFSWCWTLWWNFDEDKSLYFSFKSVGKPEIPEHNPQIQNWPQSPSPFRSLADRTDPPGGGDKESRPPRGLRAPSGRNRTRSGGRSGGRWQRQPRAVAAEGGGAQADPAP